ncbi:hypothetical protein VTO73DRAFT_7790 [Trametes versicolor]
MTSYNYPNCTTSVTIVLSVFRRHNAEHRPRDIKRVFTEAVDYMHQTLRPDAYGACASPLPCIAKFAVDKQRADRGWDEF